MQTDNPQIAILMAIYNPRMDWLFEQLDSLNSQSCRGLKLYIRDDCSPDVPFSEIEKAVSEHITAFPYVISQNEKNVGSNLTFQTLTEEAEADYFAYCDQDDVWLPEKLETLLALIEEKDASLVCSDVIVIDGEGNKTSDSITPLRPRHIFLEGEGLAETFLYRNFVIGCTMLVRSKVAKAALPFSKTMVHDHYLAFFAAIDGRIAVSGKPLIRYRIHGNNQTGILSRIQTKEDYQKKHMMLFCDRISELSERFSLPALSLAKEWADARVANAKKEKGAMRRLYTLRRVNRSTTMFELIGLRLPYPMFKFALRRIQKGKI